MGGPFLLLILNAVIYENVALTCFPREYVANNICCPMCDKGSFVKSHCASSSSSSVCVLCEDNTYMDHPNGLTKCFRCKDCDKGAGQTIKEKCTATSDTVCKCKDGLYCANQECDLCLVQTVCGAGQYVKEPATEYSDTVCEDCQSGHFRSENNSLLCIPWSKCSELGLVLYKEGTSTTDAICKEKRSHIATIVPIVAITAIAAILLLFQIYCSLKQEGELEGVIGNECCLSEEEKGATDNENQPTE